ncbi:MAG: hypothetical protein VXW51_01960 [Pseudomonadota bacterium]|nr:hypothetical protein [Pseudomonadota bacterium]|tara:strand:- start:416 stop:631 length:216 start_codon:yes stop_codon:yes gene_type:complete
MKTIKYEVKLEKSVKIILGIFAIGVLLNAFSSPIANELFGMKDVFAEILGGTVFLEHKGGLSLTHYGAIGN